jgi:hypothetical protein
MTSQGVPLEHGLLSIPIRKSVVIQVQELPLTSPTQETASTSCHGLVEILGKMEEGSVDTSRVWIEGLKLERPQTSDGQRSLRGSQSRRRRRSSVGSMDCRAGDPHSLGLHGRPILRLPSFEDSISPAFLVEQSDSHQTSTNVARSGEADVVDQSRSSSGAHPESFGLFPTQSWPLTSHMEASSFHYPCGIQPLLTPPEDIDSFKWDTAEQTESSGKVRTVPENEPRRARGSQTQEQPRSSPTARPSEIQMPAPSNMSSDESNMSNWLGRACQHLGMIPQKRSPKFRLLIRDIVSASGDPSSQQQIQMVVQALPSQAKKSGNKPVFEKVVEVLQGHYTLPPYITITHAVSQVMSMDEVPASPPATPNTNYSSDDYFQDQTIFTHAAVVPAYHAQNFASTIVSPRPSNIIAAPSSIQFTILERYIPPTTGQEVHDFFTMSRKSYLADRLLELSANNGTLLLVYPTKTGGMTFAKKYIGPIIEPFLRQFILLNNLFVNIAVDLGRMASLEGMKEFSELGQAVRQMCQALGQRASARSLQSRYEVVHDETTEVVLKRNVWKEWFLEQEQPRLRQNLVDYHKAGGRMPSRVGQIETTPSMLAREVADGIRSSREPAGDVGIEVAVFVIRRSMV